MALDIVSVSCHSSKDDEHIIGDEEEAEEDEYIDIEVSSYSIFMLNENSREFEFHMSSSCPEREQPFTSPADELFYKGKLLPLHLPPRLQMVEKLLEKNSSMGGSRDTGEELYCTPLATSPSTPSGIYGTPFESCNGSPSESRAVSGELNPSEYMFQYMEGDANLGNPKKSWGNKMKLIRQSLPVSKLKAPKTFLMSLFSKYSCSHESNIDHSAAIISKNKNSMNQQFMKFNEKHCLNTNVMTRSFRKEREAAEKDMHQHRKSLSGLSKRCPSKKASIHSCSSSSLSSDSSLSSNDSTGSKQLQFLKRSNYENSEMESPIQGAIKHCKQSLGKNVVVYPESL